MYQIDSPNFRPSLTPVDVVQFGFLGLGPSSVGVVQLRFFRPSPSPVGVVQYGHLGLGPSPIGTHGLIDNSNSNFRPSPSPVVGIPRT